MLIAHRNFTPECALASSGWRAAYGDAQAKLLPVFDDYQKKTCVWRITDFRHKSAIRHIQVEPAELGEFVRQASCPRP